MSFSAISLCHRCSEGGAFLILLDLSAAFDAIDHQKLLNQLDQSFGIRGVAIKWFESYLRDQAQTAQIRLCTSTPVTLKYGVPQGSVLDPILFTMYTTPLGNIIRKHGLNFHFTRTILSCIFPSNRVYTYQRRQQYIVLKPVSRI